MKFSNSIKCLSSCVSLSWFLLFVLFCFLPTLCTSYTSDQSRTLKCASLRCRTCPFIHKIEKISGPKQSIKITDHFTCALCKKLYIGETGRWLGDRFCEHLPDLEKDNKNKSKPVTRHLNLPNHSKQHMAVYGLSLHQGSKESRKTQKKIFFLKSTLLVLTVSTKRFSFN